MFQYLKRGAINPLLLLLLIISSNSNSLTLNEEIASDLRWLALLHIYNGEPTIKGNFLLSEGQFSALNELDKTIKLFQSNNPKHKAQACHFIARYYFLNTYYNAQLPQLTCPKYNEFASKAPAQKISIIFASENLTQPSSMMGHSMLTISDETFTKQHSISFFTDMNESNPFDFLWNHLYQGKVGYFIVKPLNQSLFPYLNEEQRNIWRYHLKITKEQKALFQRHIWELKHAKITYLFNNHNCATLNFDILRVIQPKLIKYRQNWITPIDVVKAANNVNLITNRSLIASTEWKVRLLNKFTDYSYTNDKNINEKSEAKQHLSALLAYNFHQYQFENNVINHQELRSLNSKLYGQGINLKQSIQLENIKDPIDTPNDSQWGLFYSNHYGKSWMNFQWMPASHQLMDDNSQHYSDNELKLLQSNIRINRNSIQLQSLHLYSVKSLLSNDSLTGGVSGNLEFGFDRVYLNDHKDSLASYIKAGVGKSYNLHKDLKIYGLWQFNLSQTKDVGLAGSGPIVGLMFNQLLKMKTHLSTEYRRRSSQGNLTSYKLQHSVNFWSSLNIALQVQLNKTEEHSSKLLELGINVYY